MHMNQRRRLVGAVLAVLVLGSCSFGSSDVAPQADSSTRPPATPTPSSGGTEPTPGDSDNSHEADADEIRTRTLTAIDPRYHATWPDIPGADPLNQALTEAVKAQVVDFVADLPEAAPDAAAAVPELNIGWHLIAESDTVVGVRLTSYLFAGAGGAERSRTWWFDRSTSELVDNSALSADPDKFARALAWTVRAPGVDRDLVRDSVADGLSDVSFTDSGALEVRFDEYAVAPGSSGVVTVRLSADLTTRLLTDFGGAARAAASVSPVDAEDDELVTPAPPQGDSATHGPDDSPSVEPNNPESGPESGESEHPGQSGPDAGPNPGSDREVDCSRLKCVALTFDDGPVADTERLLRKLRHLDAPATFFVLGQQAAVYPETLAKVARAGHEIGVHTWDHKQLTSLGGRDIRDEIVSSVREVRKATGVRPTLLRPPYGATGPRIDAITARLGLAQVLWNVDTRDWAVKSVNPIVREVRRSARRNSIVLMHDIHRTSVDAVPQVVRTLRNRGYTLVTVSQLLGDTTPGHRYYSGN